MILIVISNWSRPLYLHSLLTFRAWIKKWVGFAIELSGNNPGPNAIVFSAFVFKKYLKVVFVIVRSPLSVYILTSTSYGPTWTKLGVKHVNSV